MIEDANLDKMQKALRIAYKLERLFEKKDSGLYVSLCFYGGMSGVIFKIANAKTDAVIIAKRYYYDTALIGQTMNDLIADVAREYRRATGRQYDTEKEYANNDYQGKEELK